MTKLKREIIKSTTIVAHFNPSLSVFDRKSRQKIKTFKSHKNLTLYLQKIIHKSV